VNETPPKNRQRFVFWLKMALRLAIIVLVAWGIWRTVEKSRGRFAESGVTLTSLKYEWLLAAGFLYLLGTFLSCVFWQRTLQAMGQKPRFAQTMLAFFIGHLGKYVPGKAMVVVLRAGLVRGPRVDTTVAAASVFVESLTMMAVGAVVAAGLLALLFRHQQELMWSALVIAAAAGLPTLPPVFRRLVRLLQVHRAGPNIEVALRGLNWRLIVFGWVIITLEWLLFGLSLWATMLAVPGIQAGLSDLPLLTTCVCLAMIAGFVSLLPGGIGVREAVMMQLITPAFGPVAAFVAAVLLRVVWLIAELIAAGCLYWAVRPARPERDRLPQQLVA